MHEAITMLAERYGVKLSERNASDSWTFDGESIALAYLRFRQTPKHDRCGKSWLYCECELTWEEEKQYGKVVHHSDHDLLHEIGHYVAANPEQRDLPEYGLSLGITNGQCYGPYRKQDGTLDWNMLEPVMHGLVDREEQQMQECMAQLLSVYWGQKYGIDPVLSSELRSTMTESWNAYLEYKRKEWYVRGLWTPSQNVTWNEACSRLARMNLLVQDACLKEKDLTTK